MLFGDATAEVGRSRALKPFENSVSSHQRQAKAQVFIRLTPGISQQDCHRRE